LESPSTFALKELLNAMHIEIDQERLNQEIEMMASFSADNAPAVTRIVFSKQDMAARSWLKARCLEAGLLIREDAVGNTFARWVGSQPDLPAVGTGSHIDAIPHAGRYDGVVGVLGGLAAMRALQRGGFTPRRSIELVVFTAEEPTRFGIGCLGSRLLSGTLDPTVDQTLRDSEGTLQELRHQAGFQGNLESVALPDHFYSAFVELHIEQGPVLESERVHLGIVTSIAAPASFRLHIEGEGGHAGGRLMRGRRDALCAAADVILAVEGSALANGTIDTVATVGICQVHPGAINSIPSKVDLSIDLRDTNEDRRNQVEQQIRSSCNEIALNRKVTIDVNRINADAPAQCAPEIVSALTDSCAIEQLSSRPMVSRAYHDSLFMARIAPVGMLFIPCRDGVSHRPDEFAHPLDICRGVQVLARALAKLSETH
jgi:N-carbamoyl-L-amino-acid hydrolase